MLPEVEVNLCSLGIKLNLLLFDDGLRSGCGYIISHIHCINELQVTQCE